MIKKSICLLSLTLNFYLGGCALGGSDVHNNDHQTVHSAVAQKRELRLLVETTGQVIPNREIEIKCKASGEITKLTVDVSDRVSIGDLLLQLDPEKEERLVRQNEVNLAISKARLRKAQFELNIAIEGLKNETKRAQSALKSIQVKTIEAKARLARQIQLNQQKLSPPEELERARSSNAQAEADLITAEARISDLKIREHQINLKREDVRIAEAQVKANELSLSNASERLRDTTVLAPIDGIVAERLVQPGQIIASGINNVSGGTRILSLLDLSKVFVRAQVDESDIAKIKEGQYTNISLDAHPGRQFEGIVRRVAIRGKIESNIVSFEVRIEVISKNKLLLKPQMTANIEILALEKENVLTLPVEAVRRKRRQNFVLIQSDKQNSELREIKIGASNGRLVEVLQGLKEGEKVILPEIGSQSRWSGKSKSSNSKNKALSDKKGIRAMGRRSSQ